MIKICPHMLKQKHNVYNRVIPFLTFCLEVFLPASFLMQFDTLISNITSVFQNSKKI